MIERKLKSVLEQATGKGLAVVLMGARQVGKSTLLRQMFGNSGDTLFLNGDEPDVQALLTGATSTSLRAIIGNHKTVVIDEAQHVQGIGMTLKLIADNLPQVQLVATGSSSFELANRLNEPLTGRKFEYHLFPLSFGEMVAHTSLLEEKRMIKHRMIYGYYPQIVVNQGDERELLHNLTDSYLYKDVLSLDRLHKPRQLVHLLQCLALQIGSQVSHSELAQAVGIDSKTVERYIELLKQCYIIFELMSFSRNMRNELKKSHKYYFYDNGVRNAVISNYAQLESRQPAEVGALWENFAIAERQKMNAYHKNYCSPWFWRTKSQQEIDYIEERDGVITAFEFKWSAAKRPRIPESFARTYGVNELNVVSPENIHEFLLLQ